MGDTRGGVAENFVKILKNIAREGGASFGASKRSGNFRAPDKKFWTRSIGQTIINTNRARGSTC